MNKFFPFLSKRRTEGRTASTRRAQFGFCCLLTPQLNFDQVLNALRPSIFRHRYLLGVEGTKICQICQRRRVGVKNCETLWMFYMNGPFYDIRCAVILQK